MKKTIFFIGSPPFLFYKYTRYLAKAIALKKGRPFIDILKSMAHKTKKSSQTQN